MKLKINRAPSSIWRNPIDFIAAGFGVGAMPIAPGTFGTLAAIPFVFLLSDFGFTTYLCVTLLMLGFGVPICDRAGKHFGVTDHSAIVWDEFASFFIVMAGIPAQWHFCLIGFLLFRLLDIWKPGPIRWVERKVSGGLGVMLDDIFAALVVWLILFIIS